MLCKQGLLIWPLLNADNQKKFYKEDNHEGVGGTGEGVTKMFTNDGKAVQRKMRTTTLSRRRAEVLQRQMLERLFTA